MKSILDSSAPQEMFGEKLRQPDAGERERDKDLVRWVEGIEVNTLDERGIREWCTRGERG